MLLLGGCSSTTRSFGTEEDASVGSLQPSPAASGNGGKSSIDPRERDAAGPGETPRDDAGEPPEGTGGAPTLLDASLPPISGATTAAMGGVATSGMDASTPPACEKDFDCDDGVDCTQDRCTETGCENTAQNSSCNQAAEGTCDPVTGCQYPSCTAETCSAGSCQSAKCVGDVCVRESLCTDGESCCAGACVKAGCDDGVSCTQDRCGVAGCENTPLDALCDDKNVCTTDACDVVKGCAFRNNADDCNDGVFCNGADRCAAGKCSEHAGQPCAGNSQCEEARNTCSGCAEKKDCPADVVGEWSTCNFGAEFCEEKGTQTRTITSFTCSGSGACLPEARKETRECTRKTSGLQCAETEFGQPTACEYRGPCASNGAKSRKRTDYLCGGGVCGKKETVEKESCSRVTKGHSCGLCKTCDGKDACSDTPVDDDQCPVIDCPSDTECTDFPADAIANRCAEFGSCKTKSICTANHEAKGTQCGKQCASCDGDGNCSLAPADDARCGVIDCPASTTCRKYGGDITANRCEALNQCTTTKGCEYEDADWRTLCGSDLQCTGTGACRPPTVICPATECARACCFDGAKPACGASCDDVASLLSCDEAADCNGKGEMCCATMAVETKTFGSECSTTCAARARLERKLWLCKGRKDCPTGMLCTGKLEWGQGFCQASVVIDTGKALTPITPPAISQ